MGRGDKLVSQVHTMITDDYSPPRRQSQHDTRRDTQCVERKSPHKVRPYWYRLMQAGIVAVLVFIGVVCVGLLDSGGIKARFLASVANTYSDSTRAHSLLKKHYTTADQSAKTVAACEGLVKLKPTDPGAQVLLGDAYADVGRVQEAISCFCEAISLDPNCFDAHLGLGGAYFDRGRYSDAVDSYERALRIRPASADAHLALGIALSNSGRYDEAMQAFKRAKELDPHVSEAQVLTGRAYLRAGMCAQAIECLKGAVEIDEGHAQAYYNLGRAYLQVGDKELALEQQRILEGLNPHLAGQLYSLIQQ
jgi:tetratricopeptide (TPR) repeat protein